MAVVAQDNFYAKRNRRKPLSLFLQYVKHLYNCEKIQDLPLKGSFVCNYKLCDYVNYVTSHKSFINCQSNKSCNVSSCYSSSKLLLHCKECSISDCSICYLIKREHQGSKIINMSTKEKEMEENFLDRMCGIYFEGKSKSTCTSVDTKTVETQTGDCHLSLQNRNRACLPDGLVLELLESTGTDDGKDSQAFVSSALRMTQIHGFIKIVIGKIDSVTMLDRKIFYFLMYVTSVEAEVYRAANSKEEYLRMLLEKIREANEKFKEYKKQKSLSIQDAAYFYFKNKIIHMLGSDELREIIFPDALKIRIEEPPKPKEVLKSWQKAITSSYREKEVIKMCSKMEGPFFSSDLVILLQLYREMEESIFSKAHSKNMYYSYFLFKDDYVPTKKNKYKKIDLKSDKTDEHKKEHSSDTKKNLEEPPEDKIVNKIPNDETVEDGQDDLEKVSFVSSDFCYSHNLVLTYIVTHKLWKKTNESLVIDA